MEGRIGPAGDSLSSRHNGCDRYIAKTFQPVEGWAAEPSPSMGAKPDEAYAARHMRNRVVTRAIRPCMSDIQGFFIAAKYRERKHRKTASSR